MQVALAVATDLTLPRHQSIKIDACPNAGGNSANLQCNFYTGSRANPDCKGTSQAN